MGREKAVGVPVPRSAPAPSIPPAQERCSRDRRDLQQGRDGVCVVRACWPGSFALLVVLRFALVLSKQSQGPHCASPGMPLPVPRGMRRAGLPAGCILGLCTRGDGGTLLFQLETGPFLAWPSGLRGALPPRPHGEGARSSHGPVRRGRSLWLSSWKVAVPGAAPLSRASANLDVGGGTGDRGAKAEGLCSPPSPGPGAGLSARDWLPPCLKWAAFPFLAVRGAVNSWLLAA